MSAHPASPARTQWIDLRTEPHHDVLDHVDTTLGLTTDRAAVIHGNYGVTEGMPTSSGTWVRIQRRPRHRLSEQSWIGAEAASTLTGVSRPDWYRSVVWTDTDRDVVWRADELELVSSPVIGDTTTATRLPDSWWTGLHTNLDALARNSTTRVGMRQEHLTRRVNEVFPGVDTSIEQWRTAHADLHWANLTRDGHLLDWEDWGAAPRGLDAAYLWGASLPVPDLADRVLREFTHDLATREGRLARLLLCANIIRIATKQDATTPLLQPAKHAAHELLTELTG
ncbi:hypothetical protein [Kutzneria albida]|uniref:Aminoglycoside phosphotransferase domain-containing protein n=1 Tax=Kutzneria albida DSM 43870 TaxID=1449976 RepID=W5WDR2_9PSEU|nr:hypothetical protein [Kutzneria albida]AHH98686.1 hypothetical protein KALB_5324 [Kutzneria albida DSM 43870]